MPSDGESHRPRGPTKWLKESIDSEVNSGSEHAKGLISESY